MQATATILEQWLEEAEALVFDCDGTLVDTMPTHYEAWRSTLAEWNCAFPEALFYQLGGMPARRIIAKLNHEQGLSMPVEETAHAKEDRFLELSDSLQVIDPAAQIARRFFGRKPMAVASGGLRRVVMHALEAAEVTSLFPVVVTSDDVEHGKPAPDTYLLAAERLGVRPERCVIFEDADTGIAAAEAAGGRCVHVQVEPGQGERRFRLHPRQHA